MPLKSDSNIPIKLRYALQASQNNRFAVRFYHFVRLDTRTCCGAFGDGENGWYEWFIWADQAVRNDGGSLKIILDGRNCRGRVISSAEGSLLISDQQYGDPAVALRDVLILALA